MTVPGPLQQFVVLAKSAKGAACADIIKQATSSNGVYSFTSLLQSENVKNLAGTEHEKSLNLLKLFSWGTYQDYKGNFPPLNEAQIEKLRRLTLVTLASESHDLHYATLMNSLDITTTRQLEDLCINTIYGSLLTGKLSPHTQTFQITSVTSRDVSPTTIDYEGMIATLSQWSKQCDLVLAEISGRIKDVRSEVASKKAAEEEFEKQLEEAKKGASGKKATKGKGGSSGAGGGQENVEDDGMMDVEGGEEGSVASPKTEKSGGGGESPKARKRKDLKIA